MDYEKYINLLRLANQGLGNCKKNGFVATLGPYTSGMRYQTGADDNDTDVLEWGMLNALDELRVDNAPATNNFLDFIMCYVALPEDEFKELRMFIRGAGWQPAHARDFDRIFGIE